MRILHWAIPIAVVVLAPTIAAQVPPLLSVDVTVAPAYAWGGGSRIGGYAGLSAPRIAVRRELLRRQGVAVLGGVDAELVLGMPGPTHCEAIEGGACSSQSLPHLLGAAALVELRAALGGQITLSAGAGLGSYRIMPTNGADPVRVQRAPLADVTLAVPRGNRWSWLLGYRVVDLASFNPINFGMVGIRRQ